MKHILALYSLSTKILNRPVIQLQLPEQNELSKYMFQNIMQFRCVAFWHIQNWMFLKQYAQWKTVHIHAIYIFLTSFRSTQAINVPL